MGWSELFSLTDGGHHLIAGPDPELYDLSTDRAERRNLRASERRLYAEWERELEGYDRELKAPVTLDDETRQAMAALGYLGGVVAAGGGPLPDPKSKVGTLVDFRTGMRLLAQKDFDGAAAALRRTVAANPRMADGWELLGQALQHKRDTDGAIAAYKKSLEASGNVSHVAVSLASVLLSQGRLDDAELHAKMAVASSPSFAHGLLAQIAKERGDLATAEREATLALAEKGTRVGPLIALAEVYQAQGRLEQALAKIREAEAAFAEREAKDEDLLRGLELARGRTLADLGDGAGAEAAFEREIARFPDQLRAYSSLAILHGLLGDAAKAGSAIRRMVQANESPSAYVEAVKTYRVLRDEAGAAKLLAFALRRYPDHPDLRRLRTESGLRAAASG
jgi:tetratricopeptide (TPR) repeat protein